MLDLAGKPPAPAQPEVNLKSINKPSVLSEVLAGVLVVTVGLLTLVMFFMARSETTKLQTLDEEHVTLTAQVQSGKLAETAKKAEQVAQALAVLKKGNQDGLVWTGLMKTLQGVSTNGITLVSLSIDARNTMKLEGTSPTYLLLAHYLATLRTAPVLKKVDLVSASLVESLEGQGINFVMQIEIDPLLVRKTTTVKVGEGN
jgi:hypothetical protein